MQSNFLCLILLLILLLVFTVNSTLPLNLIICFFKFNFKNRFYIITLFQLKAICTCTPDSAKSRGHNSLRVQVRMHCYSLQWVGESVQSHWQTQVRNSGDFRANLNLPMYQTWISCKKQQMLFFTWISQE